MELKELYQEIILDHAKNPRNKGKCNGFNHDAKAHNPLCGEILHDKLGIPASARASIGVYNNKDDMDVLCESINKCKKVFQI